MRPILVWTENCMRAKKDGNFGGQCRGALLVLQTCKTSS